MIKIGIIGGTRYTGVELLRLLAQHPDVELKVITSRAEAGKPVAEMFPNLRRAGSPSAAGAGMRESGRGRVSLAFSEPDEKGLAD